MEQLRVAEACKNVMLVVDDDSAVRNSLKFILEVEGFQVRVYSSVEELLNEASVPDLPCGRLPHAWDEWIGIDRPATRSGCIDPRHSHYSLTQ
jgi:hypothetical protein